MEIKQAIEVLREHQDWRLGKTEEMPYSMKVLTKAIDVILQHHETK